MPDWPLTEATAGRSPGAVLSRWHARRRGLFEVATILVMAAAAGLALWSVWGALLGAGLTGLIFLVSAQVRGAMKVADAGVRQAYTQLEALMWLRDMLKLKHPLRPTRGYAASPDFLLELVRIIDEYEPKLILELGSGVSTVVMAAKTSGRLISLDHDPHYAEQTRIQLRLHGLSADVVDSPLVPVTIGAQTWLWYTLPDGLSSIDMLVVDGPPASTGELARYPAIPMLADHLSPGAVICVDDAIRKDERAMVDRWVTEDSALSAEYLANESGTFVIRTTQRH